MRAVFVCLVAALAVSASVPKPFKGQQSYVYRFDTQVSSSLVGSASTEITQQAVTRLRADVHISFTSDRHARLQLQHVRIGELNAELPKPQRVTPLEHFERVDIPSELKKQLEMPFSVSLVGGAVENIHFHEEDYHWTKNIKRAVLNTMQLNLKQNDLSSKQQRQMSDEEKDAAVFRLPEMTLEGECESVYTIQQARPGQQQRERENFNVTKTIDFAKCQRVPVVNYGYAPKASQEMRCWQCLRTQSQQQNAQQMEQIRNTHCSAECVPSKLNADNDVERSTFARYELIGTQDSYAIKRVNMLSSYVVKGFNAATQNAITQVVSLSELTFKQMDESDKLVPTFKQSSTDESLLYDAQFDKEERRFYMSGDEEYEKNSPFKAVPKKESKVAHSMRSIMKQWGKRAQGYESETTMHFNRIVQFLRESSVQELRRIEDAIRQGSQQQSDDSQQSWCENSQGEKCQEQARAIFVDALAVAATRNTLFVLAEKIMKNDETMTPLKAAAALQLFSLNQHSPSEQQVEILQKIAKHEVAHRNGPLKQAAWMTLGAAIGNLCQPQPTQSTHDYWRVEELCSRNKREAWRKTLLQQWNDANTQYEQILALKTIGNAALDVMLPELQAVITDKREQTIIRGEAIDALRRLRTTQATKIRQTLLPIFMNQQERPEIRMASLSMILYTQPEKALLDQIAFSLLTSEQSSQVKAFVFTALKALSQSPSSAEREVSEHLASQLKVIEIDEEDQTKASKVIRAPIYTSDQSTTEEQTVFLRLASIMSPSSSLPVYMSAALRQALNGQATEETVKLSFTQQNLDQFYTKMADMFNDYAEQDDDDENKDRMERRGAKDLRSIYSSLGIKSKRTGSYYISTEEDDDEQSEQQSRQQQGSNRRNTDSRRPFGMIVLRSSDIDMAVLPISEEQLPQVVRKMLVEQQKPSMSELEEITRMIPSARIEKHAALMLNEKKTKIPTTSGLPLALIRQVTAVGSMEAQLQTRFSSNDMSSGRGLESHLKMRTAAVVTHSYETVVWTPMLSTGLQTHRTLELNLPVELKLRADKSKLEIKVLPMSEDNQRTRIFGMHTLPITYVRQIDASTQEKRESRVKTVHDYTMESAQKEWHQHEQSDRPIIVEGTYHQLSTPKQMLQALYTAENNMHVYLNNERAPREIVLRVSGSAFEQHKEHGKPEFEQFYEQSGSSSRRGFSSIFEDDDKALQSERDDDRRKSLNDYTQQYEGKQAYKHQLKIDAEAKYSSAETARASVELKGSCDSRIKHCKAFVTVERSPMRWLGESQPWEMKAKIQTIAPALIRDEEEPSQKQSRMLVKSEITWGTNSETNELNLRIQAEPTRKQTSSRMNEQQEQQQQQQQQSQRDRWSRFLNKLDINAEYKLRPYAKHIIQSMYAAAKARMYWQLTTEQRRNDEDSVRATIVVDPITRQYANISVQTPQERVRVEGVEVPATVLALTTISLNRRPTQYHSLTSMISDYSGFEKAQCKVNERRVKTFDGVSYRAPMSDCWTVLAKDCGSGEQPRFAVLMKKGDQTRVKVITQDSTIELYRTSDNERVKVKVDDEEVKDEQRLSEQGIELSYDRAYVQKRGIDVTFDGEEAKIKLSSQYKNKQCGLCGHHDDDEDNEFRNSDGKRSNSLKEFHRSFLLKNEKCSGESSLDKFYEDNNSQFDRNDEHKREQARRRYGSSSGSRRSQWFDSDEESEEERQNTQRNQGWMNSNSDEETDMKNIKPVDRTEVYEYNNKICFSFEPVKRCPRGTSADNEEKKQQKKVQFFCVNRTEGRKLQRQVRHGEIIDNEGRAPAFVESVHMPSKCVAY